MQATSSPAPTPTAAADAPSPRGAGRSPLIALLLFTALAAWLYRDLVVGPPGVVRLGGLGLERSDQLLHAWTLDWVYHQLPRAPLQLFDAEIFWPHPEPLALSDHLFGVAMTLLPVRAFTAEPLRVNALGTVLTFVLAGVAVAALVRGVTRNPAAGVVAGVLYAFNPFRSANLDQVQLLADYATPLAFLFLFRFQARGRAVDLVLLALAWAWQLLCSAYLGAFLAPVLGLALLWGLVRGRPARRPPAWAWGAAAAAAALVVAPFLAPYAHLRTALGLRQHVMNSIVLSLPLDALACTHDCVSLLGPAPSLALAVALLGLVPGGRTPAGVRSTGVVVAFVALALALGPYVHRGAPVAAPPDFLAPGPYFALWRWVPGFDGLRAPVRAVALYHFALALLAGVGVARVAEAPATEWTRGEWGTALCAFAVVWAVATRPPLRFEPLPGAADVPPVYAALAADPDGGPVVELPMRYQSDLYTYYASFHRRPLVNGYSGVLPYSYRYIEAALVCYPCDASLAVLRDLDVRTHVLHLELVGPEMRAALRARVAAAGALAVTREFGDTLLLRFTPPPAPAPPADLRPLARGDWHATSSRGPAPVVDGRTTWSSAPTLDRLEEAGAGMALLRTVPTWEAFLALMPQDMQWYRLDLDGPHALRRATLRMSAWAGFLPAPAPLLEGSLDGVGWVPLGSMPAVLPSLRAFTQHGPDATFAYDLPGTPLRHLRVRYPGAWRLVDLALAE